MLRSQLTTSQGPARLRRSRLALGAWLLVLATACTTTAPAPVPSPAGASPRTAARPLAPEASVRVIGSGADLIGKIRALPDGKAAELLSKIRLGPVEDAAGLLSKIRLAPAGEAAELLSKIRLVPVTLAGNVNVIANNSGSLTSKVKLNPNSASGLVSNNGAAYDLLAAAPEAPLADATVEVLDAAGRVLVDVNERPIAVSTTAKGTYRLAASLPDESLVLRVRLAGDGQVQAMLARGRGTGAGADLDLDTASSLAAAYVLDRFVQGRFEVFDRLPADELATLQRDMAAARGRLAAAVDYAPAALAAAVDTLRGLDEPVNRGLERIQAVLLAGQRNLGNGLIATSVSLAFPNQVVGDGAGNLYVAETASFRIRKIGTDGRITVIAGPGTKAAGGGRHGPPGGHRRHGP